MKIARNKEIQSTHSRQVMYDSVH